MNPKQFLHVLVLLPRVRGESPTLPSRSLHSPLPSVRAPHLFRPQGPVCMDGTPLAALCQFCLYSRELGPFGPTLHYGLLTHTFG